MTSEMMRSIIYEAEAQLSSGPTIVGEQARRNILLAQAIISLEEEFKKLKQEKSQTKVSKDRPKDTVVKEEQKEAEK